MSYLCKELKIGDVVYFNGEEYKNGEERTIVDIDSTINVGLCLQLDNGFWVNCSDVQKKHPLTFGADCGVTTTAELDVNTLVDMDKTWTFTLKNNNNTFMSNIINKVKNLTLKKEDKLLRKHGVENECGEPTDTGLQLAAIKCYHEYRDAIIEDVQAIEDEENDKK